MTLSARGHVGCFDHAYVVGEDAVDIGLFGRRSFADLVGKLEQAFDDRQAVDTRGEDHAAFPEKPGSSLATPCPGVGGFVSVLVGPE